MRLERLSLLDFKNYAQIRFEFAPKINCFTGDNGSGKTNVLDGVHYLSLCKSHINSQDSLNIRHGANAFMIQGEFVHENTINKISCSVVKGQNKVFKKDKKEYEKLSQHIGCFPSVMISPSDSELISEGSEIRRRFIDSTISQIDANYLQQLLQYQKALKQRNTLLKSFHESGKTSYEMLQLWNERLITYGMPIYQRRFEFIEQLVPIFKQFYSEIAGNEEDVDLLYTSQLHNQDFNQLLSESMERDISLLYTSNGIHKDDLVWKLNGYQIRRFGSQGQQKTYLTSLKLAVYVLVSQTIHIHPILLLDDLFDKFDNKRVENIIKIVSDDRFGQIFITDTNTSRMKELLNIVNGDNRHYLITNGNANIIS